MAHNISLETPGYRACTGCPVPEVFRESVDPTINEAKPKILEDAAKHLDDNSGSLILTVVGAQLNCPRTYDGSPNISPSVIVELEVGRRFWLLRRKVVEIDFRIQPKNHDITFPCPAIEDNFVR